MSIKNSKDITKIEGEILDIIDSKDFTFDDNIKIYHTLKNLSDTVSCDTSYNYYSLINTVSSKIFNFRLAIETFGMEEKKYIKNLFINFVKKCIEYSSKHGYLEHLSMTNIVLPFSKSFAEIIICLKAMIEKEGFNCIYNDLIDSFLKIFEASSWYTGDIVITMLKYIYINYRPEDNIMMSLYDISQITEISLNPKCLATDCEAILYNEFNVVLRLNNICYAIEDNEYDKLDCITDHINGFLRLRYIVKDDLSFYEYQAIFIVIYPMFIAIKKYSTLSKGIRLSLYNNTVQEVLHLLCGHNKIKIPSSVINTTINIVEDM